MHVLLMQLQRQISLLGDKKEEKQRKNTCDKKKNGDRKVFDEFIPKMTINENGGAEVIV